MKKIVMVVLVVGFAVLTFSELAMTFQSYKNYGRQNVARQYDWERVTPPYYSERHQPHHGRVWVPGYWCQILRTDRHGRPHVIGREWVPPHWELSQNNRGHGGY